MNLNLLTIVNRSELADDDHFVFHQIAVHGHYGGGWSQVVYARRLKVLIHQCRHHLLVYRRHCHHRIHHLSHVLHLLKLRYHRTIHTLNLWIHKYRHCVRFCWWRKPYTYHFKGDEQQQE